MNMRSSLPMSLLTLLPVWSACWLNAPRGEVIHLASGDSVRVLTTVPAIVPNERPGLQIEYNRYISLDDTLALKREALALWCALRLRIYSMNPLLVVVRATILSTQLIGYS